MIDPQHPQTVRPVAGRGVFIEELMNLLDEHAISVPFDAIDENQPL